MVYRKFITMFVMILMFGAASLAIAQKGVPDAGYSYVRAEYIPTGSIAVIFNFPWSDGGNPLTEALILDDQWGSVAVDATISLYLRDDQDQIITDYPANQVYLSDPNGDLVACLTPNLPNHADTDSDDEGKMTWSSSLAFGGWLQGPLMVNITGVGEPFMICEVPIHHNSADINKDYGTNVTDVQIFAVDFFSEYTFRSDLFYDGVLNLSDIVLLAQYNGDECDE